MPRVSKPLPGKRRKKQPAPTPTPDPEALARAEAWIKRITTEGVCVSSKDVNYNPHLKAQQAKAQAAK